MAESKHQKMTESSGDWQARDSIVMHGSYNQLSHLFPGHLCSKKKQRHLGMVWLFYILRTKTMQGSMSYDTKVMSLKHDAPSDRSALVGNNTSNSTILTGGGKGQGGHNGSRGCRICGCGHGGRL